MSVHSKVFMELDEADRNNLSPLEGDVTWASNGVSSF